MFEAFPKLTRFSHDWTVTEKIDGCNAQILVVPTASYGASEDWRAENVIANVETFDVLAGSRNRFLTVGKGDHHGFAQFVAERADDIVRLLGEGRHYGEWFGKGIGPRGYEVAPKEFALFNVNRWGSAQLPNRFRTVPLLYSGRVENFALFDELLETLRRDGSRVTQGFSNPEGIVMYHGPSRTAFKKTFDYDEAGKWAEKENRHVG